MYRATIKCVQCRHQKLTQKSMLACSRIFYPFLFSFFRRFVIMCTVTFLQSWIATELPCKSSSKINMEASSRGPVAAATCLLLIPGLYTIVNLCRLSSVCSYDRWVFLADPICRLSVMGCYCRFTVFRELTIRKWVPGQMGQQIRMGNSWLSRYVWLHWPNLSPRCEYTSMSVVRVSVRVITPNGWSKT